MARLNSHILILITLLPVSWFISERVDAVGPAIIPHDYTAVYKVLRNDRELAAVTINLSHQQDIWKLHGFSHDTQGFAKFLNIKGKQTTTGKWREGQFRPDDYKFSFSLIGFTSKWQALFDWQAGIIETRGKRGETRLIMDGVANDPFSLSLNLRTRLAQSQHEIPGNINIDAGVLDEAEIENHVYRVESRGPIDTPLGCLETTMVRRIRENKKRVSLGWYAQNYEFIPVQMRHRNRKGSDLELQIVSLEIDGTTVQPVAPCT